MNVSGVPVVPLFGPETVTVNWSGEIATVVDADAVAAFPSVAVTLIVYEPLTEYVVLKVAPDPLDGDPPVAVHVNV